MRRLLAATTLALLLAPADASAQAYGAGATGGAGREVTPPQQAQPAANQVAAQAGADTAGLLYLYMRQLATAGQPPTQADIDDAARQYFTNGASLYTVPSSGPGAAYFQNGAAAVSYGAPSTPSTAPTASTAPAPSAAPAPPPSSAPAPTSSSAPAAPSSSAQPSETTPPGSVGPAIPEIPAPAPAPPPPEAETSSAQEADAGAAGGANVTFGVTEAQGTNQPTPGAPALPPASNAPRSVTATPFAQNIFVPGAGPEQRVRCPPEPSLWSRIAPAFGGLLLGGLAVALWTRPRMLRDQRT